MYYSYVEIEYVATSSSPARTDLALKLLNQKMVTTAAAVTSTVQIVEYHVKYNTTTDQTHLKQTTVVAGGMVTPRKKGLPL
jgi:hypothetical protein